TCRRRRAWAGARREASGPGRSLVTPGREMNVVEHERLDVASRGRIGAGVFPHGGVTEVLVVALRFALLLVLDAEVAAAALFALEGVAAEELAELEEVGDAAGLLERLVERIGRALDRDVRPELFAQRADLGHRALERFLAARHAAVFPHRVAELLVERI